MGHFRIFMQAFSPGPPTVDVSTSCGHRHQLWMPSPDITRGLLTPCLPAAAPVRIPMKGVRSDSLEILMTFFTTSPPASRHRDATAPTLRVIPHHTFFDRMRKRAAFPDKRSYPRPSTPTYPFGFDGTLYIPGLTDISSAPSSSPPFKAARRISAS